MISGSTEDINLDEIEAIIFDFDGVLAESINVKTEAFIKLFEQFGEEVVKKVVKHHIENGGISRYKKIRYYYSEYLNKELSEKEVNEIAEKFSNLVLDKVTNSQWVKGAKDFLEKNYKKIDFFVISGTPQEELELIINKRNMKKYFKEVYGTPATKPEIAKRIINEYKYNRKKLLFIGDSLSDYLASKEENIPFLGVVSDKKTSPFPKNTRIINDFTDINLRKN